MIKLILAVTVAAVAATPASASTMDGPAGYLAAEHQWDTYWGGPTSDAQLLGVGRTACALHARGLPDVDVLAAMMGGAAMVPPVGTEAWHRGLQRVRNAVRYLCSA